MFFKKFLLSTAGILFHQLFLVFSFGILDVWLRVVTRWIGAYSIFELAPNLFTLLWSVALASIVTMVPSRKAGRILYGVVYFVFMIYAIVQYGAFLVLGRLLYISDFLYAGEGAGYASWVIDLLTPSFLVQVLALIAVGVIGLLFFPHLECRKGNAHPRWAARIAVVIICIFTTLFVPKLYGSRNAVNEWDDFLSPAFEYQQFTNANFDMELTGVYQFVVRDIQVQIDRKAGREEKLQQAANFFADKDAHQSNSMTGIFKGKNVIVVMMETMDDWLISIDDTPTLYQMASTGIWLKNMHMPQYSNGYTFNTEFAFNTSVYPYSNGNVAFSLLRNNFHSSIGATFARAGYAAESFHEGLPNFYNRGAMHVAWGYEAYNSYCDFPECAYSPLDDRFLPGCDALYEDLTDGQPFFSFVITYSPHLPFTDEDALTQTALAAYPQYDVAENREVNILRAKARLTDDMFAGLLQRLEEDGILEDTVIVAFGDHYAYGLSDKDRLQQLSSEAGSDILERTPAFIYCAGSDLSMEVTKVTQITDLAPTILNLFGLDVPKEIMGNDIFADDYEGYAIFPNGTWLTNTTYMKNGILQWNHGMTEEEIAAMNAYVQNVYQVNDAILDSDYYASLNN